MKSELLDKNKHDRKRFDCGVDALNNYLCMMAIQQSGKDNSRTFVLDDKVNPRHVMGFYTLAMAPIALDSLSENYKKTPKLLFCWIDSKISC